MEKGKKSIAVIDGQGGGIGSAIIKRLRETLAEEVEIIGLGTNAMATGTMLKGGANKGASGENAIVQTVKTVDIIIGTTGIVLANSMMGELTPKMAEAVACRGPRRRSPQPLRAHVGLLAPEGGALVERERREEELDLAPPTVDETAEHPEGTS